MCKRLKILLSVLFVLSVLTAPFSPLSSDQERVSASAMLESVSEQSLSFVVRIPTETLTLEKIELEGNSYTRVSLPDALMTSQPGAPMLPYVTEMLGVPFGVEISLSAEEGKIRKIQLDAPVVPVPQEQVQWAQAAVLGEMSGQPSVITSYAPDVSIYNAAATFPSQVAAVVNDGVLRQQRIASVAVYPVRYLPLENALLVVDEVRVELRFVGQPANDLDTVEAESEVFDKLLAKTLLNYSQAKVWRRSGLPYRGAPFAAAALNAHTNPEWTPPTPGWRINTTGQGLYHLSALQLAAAGVPVESVADENYHLYYLGTELAIQVLADDEIYFYAEKVDSKYTSENVFWLTYDLTPGLRMQTRDGSPGAQDTPASFPVQEHLEVNAFYRTLGPEIDEYDHYFWNYVYRSGESRTDRQINLDLSRYTGGDLQLSMPLVGYRQELSVDPDHSARILMNGNEIYVGTWDGFNLHQVDVNVPAAFLVAGTNTLTITTITTPVQYDYFWFDWLDFSYQRNFEVIGDKLQFRHEDSGSWKYALDGFSSADTQVYDVSVPNAPVQITGVSFSASAPYTASFSGEVSDSVEYLAVSQAMIHSDASISPDTASDLRAAANQAEYLVITHADFADEAQDLANYRIQNSISAVVIDVQDIYDEFSYGIIDPEAIRAFIAYAYAQWETPAPAYVLLVGDGNYDPKNYEGFGRRSFIPPYLAYVDPNIGETAADNRYVSIIGDDNLPDLMLGRLAVNTWQEADAYLAKMSAYETTPPAEEMRQNILAITSKAEAIAQYPLISERLLYDYFPSEPFTAQEVYWLWTHTNLTQAREDILSGLNAGRLLLNYIGHGYYGGWGDTDALLFTTANLSSLQNQGKLTFIMAMTCMDGYYIAPNPYSWDREALAEVMVRAEAKGAVGSWSAAGWGSSLGHDVLDRGAFQAIYMEGQSQLGAITQSGYINVWASGAYLDLLDTYLLFGDPAVNLPLSSIAVPDNYAALEDTELVVAVQDGVLSNDINPMNTVLSAEVVQYPQYGSLNFNADGAFAYTPNLDYCGEDSFSYRFSNGTNYSNTVVVRIQVEGVNDHPPVAYDKDVDTLVNTPVTFTLEFFDPDECGGSSFCAAAVLPESDAKFSYTYDIVSEPSHGMLNGTGPAFEYVPGVDYYGTDNFTFIVDDGLFESNLAQVNIAISASFSIFLPIIIK